MTLSTVHGRGGMVTAPHFLASQAGLEVLKDGGNAIEATVAVAAALAIVYPHMTGIGGDAFWLIHEPDGRIHAVHGCGGAVTDLATYEGLDAVPTRGLLAANTVAGAISSWEDALATANGKLPLSRLLRDAIALAETGVTVTKGGAEAIAAKAHELRGQPGIWAETFDHLTEGQTLRQPKLAATLRRLAEEGLDSFYRGAIAADIAADFADLGGLVTAEHLTAHEATRPAPLTARIEGITLHNSAPPTQGFASLAILKFYDQIAAAEPEGFDHIHRLVEATKRAFLIRDREIGDPAYMATDAQTLLDSAKAEIDPTKALPWPQPASAGDTCWFAAADAEGRIVSCIQSTYFEFGSGIVLPRTGITWQNRGSSFRLAATGWNAIRPGRKPFHTLNPALAIFDDGRTMAYGTMGGEGQPQTQAALFTRYARYGVDLQEAITRPRWLLGKTWGENSVTLKLEDRFDPAVLDQLRAAGHDVEMMPAFTATMGHAGAIVRHPDGALEGATDPRSDGQVAAW